MRNAATAYLGTRASRRLLMAACVGATAVVFGATGVSNSASAQSTWRMPWDTQTQDRGAPPPRSQPRFSPAAPQANGSDNICLDLERRLAAEVNQGRNSGDQRGNLVSEIRNLERAIDQNEARLERGGCWDQFFFQRTLRNTRACVGVYRQLEGQKRRLQDSRTELSSLNEGSRRSIQDDLMRALARNRCGPAYEQQARRQTPDNPFASFFQDYDSRVDGGERNTYRGLPFATYRTMCVRTCDGYYFPVSFSTLPNYFERDAQACQSKCAAPATLYYYQNPGGSIEQMKSTVDNSTYVDLQSAFKYRKTFVKGCSCKAAEYVPDGVQIEQSVQADTRRQLSPVR